jgi:hypothetical protein
MINIIISGNKSYRKRNTTYIAILLIPVYYVNYPFNIRLLVSHISHLLADYELCRIAKTLIVKYEEIRTTNTYHLFNTQIIQIK